MSIFQGVRFTCPFCSKVAHCGYADGDEKTGTPTVLHEFPVCEKYVGLGPIEFMRAVNDHNEKKTS